MVAQYLQQDFGDRVRVDYYDLSDPSLREKHADVVKAVEEHEIAYPLTAINGEFRFAGGISYYAILKVVEEVIAKPTAEHLEAQGAQS
jgi:disulfide oxidoreductase YuzD